jgi:argininosuccinate lyase
VSVRTCTVTIHDMNDAVHSIDVTAATLYEAVAQALAAFRTHEWVGQIATGLNTATVKIKHPEITHVVKIQDFENWLNRRGRTPAEIVLKEHLRQVLGARKP